MSNLIQSVNGANVVLNDEVLATEVWEPMFFWYWQLLNLSIKFYPVLFVVWFLWFLFGFIFSYINKSDIKFKKSLENK